MQSSVSGIIKNQLKETQMINFAQIGVGYWGPNLLRNLVSNPECFVKTVVDLSPERRSFVQANYPTISVSDDINAAIEDTSIDAVVLATPVATHFDLAMKCLNAGKHILVEKPMAHTAEEVRQIGALAKQKKLHHITKNSMDIVHIAKNKCW